MIDIEAAAQFKFLGISWGPNYCAIDEFLQKWFLLFQVANRYFNVWIGKKNTDHRQWAGFYQAQALGKFDGLSRFNFKKL